MSIMLVSNEYYKKSSKTQKIRCEICANYCRIADGNLGICRQHKNINGELYDLNYARVSSLSPDPIEKKPLYHYLPGSLTYSIGGLGCNMKCRHCPHYWFAYHYYFWSSFISFILPFFCFFQYIYRQSNSIHPSVLHFIC